MDQNAAGTVTADRFFAWDGMRIASERASVSGAPVKQYFAQGEIRNGVKYYYAKDHLGNLREVTTGSGGVVARYDYDAFGVPTQTLGTMKFDFLYTGHFYHEPSGLYLAPFRAYNPRMGRWISRDPIGVKGGINLYDYVGGNPLTRIDPTGLVTAVVIGDSTLAVGTGGVTGNPFGHAAVAVSGQGVYSFGTGLADVGGGMRNYLEKQADYRNSTVYLLNTTPGQERKILESLKKADTKPLQKFSDNCSLRSSNALAAAGIGLMNKIPTSYGFPLLAPVSPFPKSLERALQDSASDLGIISIEVPKGSALPETMFQGFDPK